jgi:hypothetical protein
MKSMIYALMAIMMIATIAPTTATDQDVLVVTTENSLLDNSGGSSIKTCTVDLSSGDVIITVGSSASTSNQAYLDIYAITGTYINLIQNFPEFGDLMIYYSNLDSMRDRQFTCSKVWANSAQITEIGIKEVTNVVMSTMSV